MPFLLHLGRTAPPAAQSILNRHRRALAAPLGCLASSECTPPKREAPRQSGHRIRPTDFRRVLACPIGVSPGSISPGRAHRDHRASVGSPPSLVQGSVRTVCRLALPTRAGPILLMRRAQGDGRRIPTADSRSLATSASQQVYRQERQGDPDQFPGVLAFVKEDDGQYRGQSRVECRQGDGAGGLGSRQKQVGTNEAK